MFYPLVGGGGPGQDDARARRNSVSPVKSSRLWIVAGAVLAGAAGAAAWGWHALPGWLQSRLQAEGTARLGRAVTVESVELGLRPLSLTVRGLQVSAAPGAGAAGAPGGAALASGGSAPAAPQLSLARLSVEVAAESLWTLTPVIERLEIEALRVSLARLGPGRLDIDDIVSRLSSPSAAATPPSTAPSAASAPAGGSASATVPEFVLRKVRMSGLALTFEDRPSGRRHVLDGLEVQLPLLSSRPRDVDTDTTAQLRVRLDGTPVSADLNARPFAATPSARVAAQLRDLPLQRLWPWLREAGPLPLQPQGGVLQAQLTVQARQPAGQPWQVLASGRAALRELALLGPKGQPMASVGALDVTLTELDLAQRKVTLGVVSLDKAEVEVRRDARGQLEWLNLPQPAATSDSAPSPGPAWQVKAGPVQIANARVRWQDATTRPAAALSLDPLDLRVESVAWPLQADSPVKAQLEARLRAGSQDAGRLTAQASVDPASAGVELQAEGLQLQAAAPYLRAVLAPSLQGRATLQARVDVAMGDKPAVKGRVASLRVQDLRLTEPGAAQPALAWSDLSVADVNLDLDAQRVSVARVRLQGPQVALQRDTRGDLNAARWAVVPPAAAGSTGVKRPPTSPSTARAPQVPPPWQARVADVLVEGGQIDWRDAATGRPEPLTLRLRNVRLAAKSLAWPLGAAEVPLELSAEMPESAPAGAASPAPSTSPPAPPGRLSVAGRLSPQPIGFKGRARLERWPAHAFEPYAGPDLPVSLRSAEVGLDATVDARMGGDGLRLAAAGDLVVADFQLQTRRGAGPGDDLATWNLLSLKPVKLALMPGQRPRVEVGEIRLADFFARLQITEQGRLNFQNPQTEAGAATTTATATAAVPTSEGVAKPPLVASASPGAAPASGAAPAGSAARWPLDLVVGSTVLSNGRVDFNDRFIRPNYSADLSELNGTLGRFESGSTAMAPLELRGRAARTALLEIRGAVNPAISPLALDLSARATDLELAPLSPYSGKYAGYLIERGKLSVDLAYRIDPDGKLEARNQIILNQLTFGDKVDSPSATSLPVRFAVALLSDRNGVIDINLPISGSINDPQFSIFGLVLKIIGNLIVKAVTAPFSLFSGGSGPEQSTVEFVPGTARIAQASLETLERVAKALADRPALRMTVAGTADPVLEREALKAAALEEQLEQARRRDAARAATATAPASVPAPAGGPAPAAAAADLPMSPAQRASLLKRLYTDTPLPDRPRNLIGQLRDLPVPEMESRLLASVVVSTDTARALALQRGLAVRDALIARGLPAERLFLGAPLVRAAGEDESGWKPRVQLTLSGP